MLKNKNWWDAALTRAVRTVCQTLAATLPVGIAITADQIAGADWTKLAYSILAWLATGLLAGVASMLTSLAGLPEVEMLEAPEEPDKWGSSGLFYGTKGDKEDNDENC